MVRFGEVCGGGLVEEFTQAANTLAMFGIDSFSVHHYPCSGASSANRPKGHRDGYSDRRIGHLHTSPVSGKGCHCSTTHLWQQSYTFGQYILLPRLTRSRGRRSLVRGRTLFLTLSFQFHAISSHRGPPTLSLRFLLPCPSLGNVLAGDQVEPLFRWRWVIFFASTLPSHFYSYARA